MSALMLIGASLMIASGLVLIGIGWRARRSHGWGYVWAGAMPVAWGLFLAAPDSAVAARYVAAAVTAVLLLAMFISMKRDLFRVLGLELLMAALALGAIAGLELLEPPPWLVSVLLASLVLAMTGFVVATGAKLVRALRARPRPTGVDNNHA